MVLGDSIGQLRRGGEDVDGTSEQASKLCPCSDLSAALWACFLEKEILGKSEKLWSEDK